MPEPVTSLPGAASRWVVCLCVSIYLSTHKKFVSSNQGSVQVFKQGSLLIRLVTGDDSSTVVCPLWRSVKVVRLSHGHRRRQVQQQSGTVTTRGGRPPTINAAAVVRTCQV